MTNELTIESARNLSDAQLLQSILDGLRSMGDALRSACIAVTVARERDIALPVLPKAFDYAEQIISGRLSPRAAFTLCRYPFTVATVLDMPHDLQERLADGEKVKIAVKINGSVRYAERSIWEMNAKQLRLAFQDGKIVPHEEQGTALHQNPYFDDAASKAVKVKSDRKTGEIIVGRARVKPEDMHQALADLGLMVVPIYKSSRPRLSHATTS